MHSIDNTTITSRIRTLPLLPCYSFSGFMYGRFPNTNSVLRERAGMFGTGLHGSAMYISVTCVHVNTQL